METWGKVKYSDQGPQPKVGPFQEIGRGRGPLSVLTWAVGVVGTVGTLGSLIQVDLRGEER